MGLFSHLTVLSFIFCLGRCQFNSYSKGCTPIKHEGCKEFLDYKLTSRFNEFMGNISHQDAIDRYDTFKILIQYVCNLKNSNVDHCKDLKRFLCRTYFPFCEKQNSNVYIVGPCRPKCEELKARYEDILKLSHKEWVINCSKIQYYNDHEICLPAPTQTYTNTSVLIKKPVPSKNKTLCINYPSKHSYLYDEMNKKCYLRCDRKGIFSDSDKNYMTIWTTNLSLFSCIGCILLLSTFLVDQTRFPYPERPVIFMSFCYFISSLTNLIRVSLGRNNILCVEERGLSINIGSDNPPCILIFIALYYFNLAGLVWFLVLSVTWILSTNYQWRTEAILKYEKYFHTFAWIIPTIVVCDIYLKEKISSEELIGMCYIDGKSSSDTFYYEILPESICLIISSSLFIFGFHSAFKIRNQMMDTLYIDERYNSLLIRIVIFTSAFIITLGIKIFCLFIKHIFQDEILKNKNQLLYTEFLKTFSMIIPGFWCCIHIMNNKTIESWKKFICEKMKINQNKRTVIFHKVDSHEESSDL